MSLEDYIAKIDYNQYIYPMPRQKEDAIKKSNKALEMGKLDEKRRLVEKHFKNYDM